MFETYRGAVAASECDVMGHLNIAFYCGRFEAAASDALERIGASGSWSTGAIDTRYFKELRAGEGFAIRSAVRRNAPDEILLVHEGMTLSGERATVAEHRLVRSTGDRAPVAALAALGEGAVPSGRDRIAAAEAGSGGLTLFGLMRRFSDACLIMIDALGMTTSYRIEARRGFATFETRVALEPPPPQVGEGVTVTSGIAEIGNSSLRFVHVLRATRDTRPVARCLQAGVNFDLERRRATPWPAEFRAKAKSLAVVTP